MERSITRSESVATENGTCRTTAPMDSAHCSHGHQYTIHLCRCVIALITLPKINTCSATTDWSCERALFDPQMVKLNVGGRKYATTESTLKSKGMREKEKQKEKGRKRRGLDC